MLDRLPHDLSTYLLEHWLQFRHAKPFSPLDIAFSNRSSRKDWLFLLSRTKAPNGSARIQHSLGSYLTWIASRQFCVEGVDATISAVNALPAVDPLWTNSRIRWFKLSPTGKALTNRSGLKDLLAAFPCLRSLSFHGCEHLVDDDLAPLLDLECPLTGLNFTGCYQLFPEMITAMICRFGSTMKDVMCDAMGDVGVQALTASCASLEKLTVYNSDAITQANELVKLCCRNPLKHLALGQHNKLITSLNDDHVQEIVTHCPALTTVCLYKCDVTGSIVGLLMGLHGIERIDFSGVRISVFTEKQRVCQVECGRQVSRDQFVKDMFDAITIPIKSIYASVAYAALCKHTLRLLAVEHSQTLDTFQCALDMDVELADMRFFIAKCRNLNHLRLSFRQPLFSFEDEDIRNLPIYCPSLTSLGVSDCASRITDAAFLEFLEGYRASEMYNLDLEGCARLTDAVLDKLPESLPRLTMLNVRNTSFSKEAVLAFLLKGMNLQSFQFPTTEVQSWVVEQLTARGLPCSKWR